ncbi:SDR family NAD(P)-dependent oxidoreductase [Streptomyces lincolnensis]|uniref:SDR family NAD(P)-dependent oxidoreductase n=1 Tax=Streptomyces lincolnensis TaxID=1915 RepID=UPI0037D79E80
MTGLRVSVGDVVDFGAASGDRNPLHLDREFALRSAYGRPVAHGALATIAALGLAADREELARVVELTVDFDQPVLPGLTYRVRRSPRGVEVRLGELRVLTARWTLGDRAADTAPATRGAGPDRPGPPPLPDGGGPRVLGLAELADLVGESYAYRVDSAALAELLSRGAAAGVPDTLTGPLAWASFHTGMRTPGRDALLVGIRLRLTGARERPTEVWSCRAEPPLVHRRTGMVTVHAELDGAASATLTVVSLLRRQVAAPTLAETLGTLPRSDALAGRTIAVIGGGRGLGAALSCSLAGQGARVLAVSSTPATALAREASAERLPIEPLTCDAHDPEALTTAFSGAALDGLVLAAAPRILSLPVAAATVPESVDHVADATRLVLAPLAAAHELLAEQASVVFVSSSAVLEPPAAWPHYVAAKAAIEGLAGHLARHRPGLRVVVARPPRMWTEMTNGPSGAAGATPVGVVAGAVVRHLLSGPATPGRPDVLGPDALSGP